MLALFILFAWGGDRQHEATIAAQKQLFDGHQVNDRVAFEYATNIYIGPVN